MLFPFCGLNAKLHGEEKNVLAEQVETEFVENVKLHSDPTLAEGERW